MKTIRLFYLKECPFCRRALQYIDELRTERPELSDLRIEMIEESEQPALADRFDYYYVPTFYVDERKVHEGGIYKLEVERILLDALNIDN